MSPARIRSTATRAALLFLALAVPVATVLAQDGGEGRSPGLVNGGMEELGADDTLAGWRVPASLLAAGYVIGPEREDVLEGSGAARLDSRALAGDAGSFGNLSQSVDAAPYRGKRVRYRAAVKVPEAEEGGQAQLWLRVDRDSPGGATRTGFFDNMGDRPIRSTEWATYEIVGDVATDARTILVGVLTLGKCLALVDAATLEVVDAAEAKPTGAGDVLAAAPRQPFWTPWLVLPLVAVGLFVLGFLGRGRAGALAFRFTLVYWALYALPTLVSALVPVWGGTWSFAYEAGPVDAVVRWVAAHVLGIEGELVSALRNGSGDSTYSYVEALIGFVLAFAAALVWSLVDRRPRDLARPRAFLRDAVRVYLAVYMVSYGLAKLGVPYNQFPSPGLDRLARTYGESSPMGLLWTFMGSSRAYTALAGAMELLSGALLVFRRTALLGALASFGVMLNVMLLNFCYDVPVKLFSTHLVVAAGCVALPDARRLAHVLVGLGPGAPAAALVARVDGARRWIRRAAAVYVPVMVLVLPLHEHWKTERAFAPVWPALGEWKLARLEQDGAALDPEPGELEYLTLAPRATAADDTWTTDYTARLSGGSAVSGKATLTREHLSLAGSGASTSRLVPGELTWRAEDGELHLETAGLHAVLTPAVQQNLLASRGFRWINERPFNR